MFSLGCNLALARHIKTVFVRIIINGSTCESIGVDMSKMLLGTAIALVAIATPAIAAETITYTYDAKGRLTKVVRTGTVNNNVQAQYTHDKANNRKNVTVTGSPNPPPP